jgi:hypothetical protein
MEAGKYEASKHQRQIVNRFNKFIQEGDENFDKDIASRRLEGSSMAVGPQDTSTAETLPSTGAETSMEIVEGKKQKPKKPPKNVTTDLKTRIRSSEYLHSPEITSWKHRLRVCSRARPCARSLIARVVVLNSHEPDPLRVIDQAGTILFYRREARTLYQISDGSS